MKIDGRTKPTAVIGWPIEQSLSPVMHNAAYEALGLNWACVPFAVPDDNALDTFLEAARRLGFVGFNVTMPHKQAVLAACDEITLRARLSGAVNTVRCAQGRLAGYNTDVDGVLESLEQDAGFDACGRCVAIIGAGGAAGAALAAFVLARAQGVAVVNRDVTRAQSLIARIQEHARGTELKALALSPEAEQAVRRADLVVNATPLGMSAGDPSPIPAHWIREGHVVMDMVYHRPATALMQDARAAGARAIGGLGMLVAQGARAIDIWMDGDSGQRRAPRDVMRAAAEAALAQMDQEGKR